MGFIAYFQEKKYNLKGHCQALFMAFIYFLISIVCKPSSELENAILPCYIYQTMNFSSSLLC